MEGNYLTIGGHTFDKFHLIEHADPRAGFSALITYALNGVRLALENNWLPVVKYDNHDVNGYFYDPVHGENVWAYYFEPVMEIDSAQVKRLLDDGNISQEEIHTYPHDQVFQWHLYDPKRIATFWSYDAPENPAVWMAEKRRLGREYVSRYIKVKPHILAKVEQFFNDNIAPQYTFGVHIRGTDFHYAELARPGTYFQEIRRLAAIDQQNDFKIFLATDQKQYVDMFQREFGRRVITYDSIRSNSDEPAFRFWDANPYKKGEDVLIDILLLSKCDYLLKCAAAVGEYALWFNPSLECVDFALDSNYIPDDLTSAYVTLNIDELSPTKMKLRSWYLRIKFTILERSLELSRKIIPFPIRTRLWKAIGRQMYYPKSDAE